MFMWSNFHTHNRYCDGKGELGDYCSQGKDIPVMSLGFSSHAPLPFPCTWCMKPDALPGYLEDIEQLRKIFPAQDIYKGLEVDFIPGVISTDEVKNRLDYTIGTIHFFESFCAGRPWVLDATQSFFQVR